MLLRNQAAEVVLGNEEAFPCLSSYSRGSLTKSFNGNLSGVPNNAVMGMPDTAKLAEYTSRRVMNSVSWVRCQNKVRHDVVDPMM